MLRFFFALTAVALIVWAGLEISIYKNWIPGAPSFSKEILFLLFITTLIIFFKLIQIKENAFVQFYLLSMAIKILAYVSFNLAVILSDKKGASSNVLFFMIVYILFTILEIAFLYRRFSPSRRA
ncbi:MAG TPA: hypothetical protein VFW11_18445 [Cyclobacteriaceae bacterium]|nr:hypothetical protein [Cyclobacteriaceae bacterium]